MGGAVQLLVLAVAVVLLLAGLALVHPGLAVAVVGALLGAAVLFVDPDSLRKGGKP